MNIFKRMVGKDKEERISYYDSRIGNIDTKANYTNGVQDGEWSCYYPNGDLQMTGTYDMGVQIGETISYYPRNGGVQSIASMENGKRKLLRYFSKEGKKMCDIEYSPQGQRASMTVFSQTTGEAVETTTYTDGVEDRLRLFSR